MADILFDKSELPISKEVSRDEILANFLKDDSLMDITLRANDGVRVPCNRHILAARSDVFHRMLLGRFSEATKDELPIDYKGCVLKSIVEYIHTDTAGILTLNYDGEEGEKTQRKSKTKTLPPPEKEFRLCPDTGNVLKNFRYLGWAYANEREQNQFFTARDRNSSMDPTQEDPLEDSEHEDDGLKPKATEGRPIEIQRQIQDLVSLTGAAIYFNLPNLCEKAFHKISIWLKRSPRLAFAVLQCAHQEGPSVPKQLKKLALSSVKPDVDHASDIASLSPILLEDILMDHTRLSEYQRFELLQIWASGEEEASNLIGFEPRPPGFRVGVPVHRFALGEKIFAKECHVVFKNGILQLMNSSIIKATMSLTGEDDVRELKYYLPTEAATPAALTGGNKKEQEQKPQHSQMIFLALKVEPTRQNLLKKYTTSYQPNQTQDLSREYVVIEFGSRSQLEDLIQRMRKANVPFVAGADLSLESAGMYCASFMEADAKEEKANRKAENDVIFLSLETPKAKRQKTAGGDEDGGKTGESDKENKGVGGGETDGNRSTIVSKLFRHIRLDWIYPMLLSTSVTDSGLVSKDQLFEAYKAQALAAGVREIEELGVQRVPFWGPRNL